MDKTAPIGFIIMTWKANGRVRTIPGGQKQFKNMAKSKGLGLDKQLQAIQNRQIRQTTRSRTNAVSEQAEIPWEQYILKGEHQKHSHRNQNEERRKTIAYRPPSKEITINDLNLIFRCNSRSKILGKWIETSRTRESGRVRYDRAVGNDTLHIQWKTGRSTRCIYPTKHRTQLRYPNDRRTIIGPQFSYNNYS